MTIIPYNQTIFNNNLQRPKRFVTIFFITKHFNGVLTTGILPMVDMVVIVGFIFESNKNIKQK